MYILFKKLALFFGLILFMFVEKIIFGWKMQQKYIQLFFFPRGWNNSTNNQVILMSSCVATGTTYQSIGITLVLLWYYYISFALPLGFCALDFSRLLFGILIECILNLITVNLIKEISIKLIKLNNYRWYWW